MRNETVAGATIVAGATGIAKAQSHWKDCKKNRPRAATARSRRRTSRKKPTKSGPGAVIWPFARTLQASLLDCPVTLSNVRRRASSRGRACCEQVSSACLPFFPSRPIQRSVSTGQTKTMSDLAPSYNEMSHVEAVVPQAHPDRLATVAKLFGISIFGCPKLSEKGSLISAGRISRLKAWRT